MPIYFYYSGVLLISLTLLTTMSTALSPERAPPSLEEKKSTLSLPHSISGSTSAQETTPQTPPLKEATPEFKPGRAFVLAFISICIITLAAALDATSLSIALPIITEKLHGSAIEAFWAGTSFLLTSAVFQPVIAGLSHVFGRKEVCFTNTENCLAFTHYLQLILASSVFFAVGSIVAAVATNMTMLLVGRSIQGIGGGGILTLGEILVTDLVPLAARGGRSFHIS
jgi:hypothetical protein